MSRALIKRMSGFLVSLLVLGVAVGCAGTKPSGGSTDAQQPSPAGQSTPAPAEKVNFPEKDITFVVPFKPGGGVDVQARLMAPYIEKYLPKQVNVVVANESAAGGKVGTFKVYDAKPDGYTIGYLPTSSVGLFAATGEFEGRDPAKFEYFTRGIYAPYLLAVGANGKFKTVQDMKGKEVRFGGTTAVAFQAALLADMLGAKLVYVTYDGLPESALAAMRGDVDAIFFNYDSVTKQVESSQGKLVAAMVTSEERQPGTPNVPTAKEAGLNFDPGMKSVMSSWSLLAAPPGLPPAIKAILEKAIISALNDPALQAEIQKANYTVKPVLTSAEVRDQAINAYQTMTKYKGLLTNLGR